MNVPAACGGEYDPERLHTPSAETRLLYHHLTPLDLQGEDGQPLSDDQGRPGQLLQHVTAQLVEHQRSALEAQALIAQLEQAGLIDDQRRLDVQLKDGRYRSFAGFKAVVPERLDTLEASTRTELTESGALRLLALHQSSLNNMARLLG